MGETAKQKIRDNIPTVNLFNMVTPIWVKVNVCKYSVEELKSKNDFKETKNLKLRFGKKATWVPGIDKFDQGH